MIPKEPIALEEGWAKMRAGIDKLIQILEKQAEQSFTAEEFMTLYTTIYNMCTQKAPHEYSEHLYTRYRKAFEDYLSQRVLPKVEGCTLGPSLLKELSTAWENHQIMVRWLTRFFNYLDRYYVVRHNYSTLNQVGLICFRDIIFKKTHERAKDALLELIGRERENEQIERDLVKNVLNIFIDVGMDNIATYKDHFQAPLIEAMHAYYRGKAVLWIQSDSCPEYLRKAEQCLLDEEDRADAYLHPESRKPVVDAVQAELLAAVEVQLIEKDTGCSAMLRDNKTDDLSRLYRLFSRVADGLVPIAEIFRKHIEDEGMALVRAVTDAVAKGADGAAAGNKKEAASAEQQFVRRVLDLQDKYLDAVKVCFSAHTLMHKALKEAFEAFCNKTVAATSTAELMANYCDVLLRKGGAEKLTDDELDRTLEKVVKLLAYISDKDMFSEFYRKKLARRLLNPGSTDEHETTFLQRLKAQCGAQFTQKMEGMVTDLRVARDKGDQFATWLQASQAAKPAVDMDAKVLTTGFWPSYKSADLALPAEMAACVEAFQRFYEDTTKHRKLTWHHSLGSVTVKAQFKKARKELVVAPYQAACLALFNDAAELSYGEIKERLNLPDDDLVRTLFSLACAKHHVLRRVGDADKGRPRNPSKDDVFAVNDDFADKMVRIRVPMPVVEDKRKVVEDVQKDRKYAIDAAIVRIMKSRKALEHQQLVVEVMQQVKRMFAPENRTIKKRLEDLISREYLERDKNNPNLYKYLA